jgi:hypothetical protein
VVLSGGFTVAGAKRDDGEREECNYAYAHRHPNPDHPLRVAATCGCAQRDNPPICGVGGFSCPMTWD